MAIIITLKDSRKSHFMIPMMINSSALTNDQKQLAYDNYNHLKISEFKKRSNSRCLENIQSNININYREELIDRLVLVSEHLDLVPDTIYSTVNYFDRYLSGNMVEGIAEFILICLSCFIIATKYEQRCHPLIEDFCNEVYEFGEFTREEILKMEKSVLSFLNFELATPSARDFLQIFVQAVISEEMKGCSDDVRALRFRCLTDYISELHLLDYTMIEFAPSMVAASAIFLGKFILWPYENPWNSALKNLTEYDASDLKGCIEKLHFLYYKNYEDVEGSAIKKKYSKREYSFVANMCCATQIPEKFF